MASARFTRRAQGAGFAQTGWCYGTTEISDYLLVEGYQFVGKLFSGNQVTKLAKSIALEEWQIDECHQRDYRLLEPEANQPYQVASAARPLVQIALRCKSQFKTAKKGPAFSFQAEAKAMPVQYLYSVLVIRRTGLGKDSANGLTNLQGLEPLHFYDQWAGIEVASFGADKQGLAIAKRRKRSLVGQEMLLGLAQLAHLAKGWLTQPARQIRPYGLKCWVRDWFGLSGSITFKAGQFVKACVSPHPELVRHYFKAFSKLKNRQASGSVN